MHFKINYSGLKTGPEYKGEITSYSYNENSGFMRIYVVFDDETDVTYYKTLEVVLNQYSYFFKFCDSFNLINEDGEINMDGIIGFRIIGKLQRGKNGGVYVSHLEPDWDCYDYEEAEED